MTLPSLLTRPPGCGGKVDVASDEDWVYKPADADPKPHTDLRPLLDRPWYQGPLLSCSAHAAAAALQHARRRAGLDDSVPSRLFVYYTGLQKAGVAGGRVAFPVGLRDTWRAINEWGAPPEPAWPYPRRRWRRAVGKPPPKAFDAAKPHAGTVRYERIPGNDLRLVRASLSEGVPVACSIAVHRGFGKLGGAGATMRIPAADEKAIDRHSVLAVGHDDAESMLTIRNSWGAGWGNAGHCRMPYEFAAELRWANDFWRVASVSA
jgi:C1A family cysteine protease